MMRKALLLLISFLAVFFLAENPLFAQDDEKSTIIGTAADEDAASNIVADPAGNIYVGGVQNNKGLIVKQDVIHTTLWSKTLAFTNDPDDKVNILFLDLVGDTVFGSGVIEGVSTPPKGAFYFKMNAQTGAMYWSKFDLVSKESFSCMRYANGKFFLIGGTQDVVTAAPPATSGKVMAVSSQTGAIIWQTPLLHYFIPGTSNAENRTSFFNATQMVNGKLYITGISGPYFSSIGAPPSLQMPLLIGVNDQGTVFLEKYFSVPASAAPFLKGSKIHYDMNQNLLLACEFYSYNSPNSLVLIKCNTAGNVLFCNYYNINNDALINIAGLNETASSYVISGLCFGSVKGSYVLKVSKTGAVQRCIGISKPNVLPNSNYGLSHTFSGNSIFLNAQHYFVSSEHASWGPSDINQIIVDEDLEMVEDCSGIIELNVPVTSVSSSLNSLTISHIPNTVSFQNGSIVDDLPSFKYCDSISLDFVQTTGCSPLTVTATISGFYSPTFYWSTGDTTSVNSLSVNSTDTVFLRVLDTKCCELFDTIVPAFLASNMTANLPADTSICLSAGTSHSIVPIVSNNNFPVQYLWSDSSAAPSLSVINSGTYWVEISDGCLIHRDSITITINYLPEISDTTDITVCADDFPVVLNPTVSPGASVLWDNGTTNPSRSVTGPGTFTFSASNGCGTVNASISVSQADLPDVNLGSLIDTCVPIGGSVALTPVFSNVSSILWSDGSTGNQLIVSASGNYTVYGSNSCGIDSAVVQVIINSLPVIGNTSSLTVCEGNFPVTLNPAVSAGASVLWDNGMTNTARIVNGPGVYTISATNNCGTVSSSITVIQTDLPDVQLVSIIDTCLQSGGSVVLVPVFINTTGVLWSDGSASNQLIVSNAGTYSVYASNSCGVDSASSVVTINYYPELDLPAVLDTCFEIGVGFSYTAPGSPGSYQWSSGSQTATEWISQEGLYTVTLTNQCGMVSKSMQVNRLVPPDLYFPEDSVRHCQKQFPVSWLHIETNFNLEIFAPYYGVVGSSVTESGWYTVHAFNGCWHKWDSIHVDLEEPTFYLPNSFTPNADGNNDRFEFKGENIAIRDIRIFNRWGEEIFTESGSFTGWDGSYLGETCPDGIYAVSLIYEDCFGMPAEFNGHVNLLR